MVAQVKTRNMIHKADNNKVSSMFIKKVDSKKTDIAKPKNVLTLKVKVVRKK